VVIREILEHRAVGDPLQIPAFFSSALPALQRICTRHFMIRPKEKGKMWSTQASMFLQATLASHSISRGRLKGVTSMAAGSTPRADGLCLIKVGAAHAIGIRLIHSPPIAKLQIARKVSRAFPGLQPLDGQVLNANLV